MVHLVGSVAHAAAQDQLPEPGQARLDQINPLGKLPEAATPPKQSNPLGGQQTRALAKPRHRSLSGAGAIPPAFGRGRRTSFESFQRPEPVGMGRKKLGIEGYMAPTRSCCNAVNIQIG